MRNTLRVSLLLVSGMLLPGWLIAAPDPEALLNVLRSSQFTTLEHVGDLPLPVLRACVNDPDDVAEPGAPFNSTDLWLPSDPRPHTRLTWAAAATDGEHYIAEFEYGGRGHHSTILLVAFDGSSPVATVMGVAGEPKASNVDELIKAAETSKTPFWHELGRYH